MPSKTKLKRPLIPKKNKTENFSDEEIESLSDSEYDNPENIVESDHETAQEKRLRMAKEYILDLENQKNDMQEEDNMDYIGMKLKEDLLEKSGKLCRNIGEKFYQIKPIINFQKTHKCATCFLLSPDERYIYISFKNGTIEKRIYETLKLEKIFMGYIHDLSEQIIAPNTKIRNAKSKSKHGTIFALALSHDNKYLVSGGMNRNIYVWNPETLQHIHTFKGHKRSISALKFRQKSHQLFSASFDRTIKIWDLDQMGYVDTLFGHEEAITDLDSFVQERCLTTGGRDGTIHLWKIIDESQLIYRLNCSAERVRYINEDYFIVGTDEGTLSIWNTGKKKPLCEFSHHITEDINMDLPNSNHISIDNNSLSQHKFCGTKKNIDSPLLNPTWITAITTLKNTDIFATGSYDSYIRLWQISSDYKSVKLLASIYMPGFINNLEFSTDGTTLFAIIGREHKFGRWKVFKHVKNGIARIKLL